MAARARSSWSGVPLAGAVGGCREPAAELGVGAAKRGRARGGNRKAVPNPSVAPQSCPEANAQTAKRGRTRRARRKARPSSAGTPQSATQLGRHAAKRCRKATNPLLRQRFAARARPSPSLCGARFLFDVALRLPPLPRCRFATPIPSSPQSLDAHLSHAAMPDRALDTRRTRS